MFHSDTFFPDVNTTRGETCSQMFIGKKSDYMFVKPMKTESRSVTALQDFSRTIGIPKCIKTDNVKTEIGRKWQDWSREYFIDTTFIEPHISWQNYAESGIGDLGVMVKRCMDAFDALLSRHGWC